MKLITRAVLSGIVLATILAPAWAAQKFTYQGRLLTTAGAPVDGYRVMVFRLWDAANSPPGNLVWSETQASVQVTKGLFSVTLGDVSAINLPFNTPYYLGVQIEADPEMTPRKLFTNAGSAARADTIADGAVKGTSIIDGAITGPKIADGAVGYAKLAANSVDSTKILDLSIVNADLADGSVGKSKIANNSVDGPRLTDDAVTTTKILDGAVTAAKLAPGTLGGVALLGATQAFTGANTFGNTDNSFTGDGSGLRNISPSYQHTIVVAKTGSAFTSISAALTSITDNSASNTYLIQVMPGTYVESFNMKSYVTIRGAGRKVVTVDTTAGMINGANNATLEEMTITTASSSNPAIWVSAVSPRFINCDISATNSNVGETIMIYNGVSPYFEGCSIACASFYAVYLRNGGGTSTFVGCDIQSSNVNGAALMATDGSVCSLVGCSLGGFYYLRTFYAASTVELLNCRLVGGNTIANGTVVRTRYCIDGSGNPLGVNVADGSVVAAQLADGSVTAAKLAANSVDSSKIVDGSIAAADIATGAVGATQLAAGAVTQAKIASNLNVDQVDGKHASDFATSAQQGVIGMTSVYPSTTLVTVSGTYGSGYLATSGTHDDALKLYCTTGVLEWRLCYGSTISGGTVTVGGNNTITYPHDTPFLIKIFRSDTHAIVDLWENDSYMSGFYRKNQ